jgi:hypothetical protein
MALKFEMSRTQIGVHILQTKRITSDGLEEKGCRSQLVAEYQGVVFHPD